MSEVMSPDVKPCWNPCKSVPPRERTADRAPHRVPRRRDHCLRGLHSSRGQALYPFPCLPFTTLRGLNFSLF